MEDSVEWCWHGVAVQGKCPLSGHETLPLRFRWLKKAVDAVWKSEGYGESNQHIFSGPDAIAELDVGKNMVSSIRYCIPRCETMLFS